jgi:ABC-2 type transport system ATP-binding protein
MENPISISAQDLVKEFHTSRGNIRAVDRVSLTVHQGETYGLIGPDGAGKSTTIRVILGLLQRTQGQSSVMGFDSLRKPFEIRERAGYIAQQFGLPSDLTVRENLQFFADIHNVARADQMKRIPALLDFAGLSEYQKRPAGKLSGGMKKKLALACSLVHEPQVLLLDEPTLGVDPISRREFWNMLSNLRAEKGLSIFVATPYMDEAERCNHVGLIYQGRLIASDTPTQIKKLVPGQMLEFSPSDMDACLELLLPLPGVLEIQTYGASIHLLVDDAGLRRSQVEAAMAARAVRCSGMREIQIRMEEAFIYLIRRQEAQNGR